jgi:glycosyltransferase involved in cell wall biosynthesis
MRVLILASEYVHPGTPLGGIFFRDQALTLRDSGVRIDVAFVEPRSLRTLSFRAPIENHFQITEGDEEGIRTIRQKGWNPFLRTVHGGKVYAWLTARLVDRYIERFGIPGLIHAHNIHWAGYAAYLVNCRHGIPYVVTEHSSNFLMERIPPTASPGTRKSFAKAARVIAVSRRLANSMEEYMDGKKVTIVPNVVDTDYFSLPPEEPAPVPFTFLAVASLDANKGLDVLIRAFARRFREDPGVCLEIAGDGPLRNELKALCGSLGVDKKVGFLGMLSREDVRAAMWRAHAVALSSFRETFGVVLIEALSTGLPVIATRSGGPEDIVTPDVGFLVAAGDEEELARSLTQVRERTSFSRNALREYAVRIFGKQAVARSLLEIYDDVLRERNVP